MRGYKIVVIMALAACIILLPLISQCQEKKRNRNLEKESAEVVRPDKGNEKDKDKNAETTWANLLTFAKDNKDELTQVSKTLLKYIDKITLDKTLDYEALITEEDETVKQAFRKVFKTVGFSYETIANKKKGVLNYYYTNVDGTTYGIFYFGEEGKDKQDHISFMKQYGEAVQITDEIYAYHYHLNYT